MTRRKLPCESLLCHIRLVGDDLALGIGALCGRVGSFDDDGPPPSIWHLFFSVARAQSLPAKGGRLRAGPVHHGRYSSLFRHHQFLLTPGFFNPARTQTQLRQDCNHDLNDEATTAHCSLLFAHAQRRNALRASPSTLPPSCPPNTHTEWLGSLVESCSAP